jgi:hypothetical protein
MRDPHLSEELALGDEPIRVAHHRAEDLEGHRLIFLQRSA